jgi:hypothetical protein
MHVTISMSSPTRDTNCIVYKYSLHYTSGDSAENESCIEFAANHAFCRSLVASSNYRIGQVASISRK